MKFKQRNTVYDIERTVTYLCFTILFLASKIDNLKVLLSLKNTSCSLSLSRELQRKIFKLKEICIDNWKGTSGLGRCARNFIDLITSLTLNEYSIHAFNTS